MHNFRCPKELAREQQRLLDLKALAGKEHSREEAPPAPDVQRYTGVDKGNKGIEPLVFVLSNPCLPNPLVSGLIFL